MRFQLHQLVALGRNLVALGADKVTVQVKGTSTGPPGSNTDIILTKDDRDVVGRARGVKVATGRLVELITAEFNDKENFLFVATIPHDAEARAMIEEAARVEDEDMIAGRGLKPSDQWKVLVSEDYYTNPKFDGKNLNVGDKLTINGQDVEVAGIFKKTGNPFFDLSFVMNEEPVRELLDIPEKYGVVMAQIEPGADIAEVSANIEKDLRRHRGVDEDDQDFEIQTPEDILETLSSVLNIVTGVLIGIAAISLLVGGIGIMNTMYTAVLQRKREIGIMKAIGATNREIKTIFLIESGMLGMAGGIIGVLLGMGLSKAVEVIATLALGTLLIQASFPAWLIIGSLVFSFAIGSLAGLFPASQASKLQPVEALSE